MTKKFVTKLVLTLFAFLVVVIQIAPFLWQVITSLKLDRDLATLPPILPKELTSVHYARLFVNSPFYQYIINSAIVALGVTILCLFIGSMAAYSIARLPIKGKGVILAIFLGTSMFPQISVVGPLFLLIKQVGLYNNYLGLIFSYALFGLPLSVWLLYGFFNDLPKELEEAAAVDGCSPAHTYWRIALPLVTPGLVTAGLLVFIAAWNEFLFAITFTNNIKTQTIPVGMAMFPQMFYVPWGDLAAASVLVTLPLIILVLIFEKKLTKGLTGGAVKG
jgi:multiple sugar transport system permease protein